MGFVPLAKSVAWLIVAALWPLLGRGVLKPSALCLCLAMLCNFSLQSAEPDEWKQAIELAGRLHNERRFTEARSALLGALSEVSSHSDREYQLAYTLNALGSVAQDQGRYFESENHYRRSVAHWQAAGEHWRGHLAQTLNNLSSLLYDAGKWREAEELLNRAQAIHVPRAGGDDPDVIRLVNSGTLHLRQRKFREAEESYRRAWAILEPQRDSKEPEFARVAHHLGLLCEATGRQKEANVFFAKARESWEKQVQRDPPLLEAMVSLAALYWQAGQLMSAQGLLQRALAIGEKELGPGHLQMAEISFMYAKLLRQTKQKTEAALFEKRARTIQADSQESLARHTIAFDRLTREERSK